MHEVGCLPDETRLLRKYLAILTNSMRQTVMLREWKLDPGGEINRKPATWEEVAMAVDMALEAAADAKTPNDHVFNLGDPNELGSFEGNGRGKGKGNGKADSTAVSPPPPRHVNGVTGCVAEGGWLAACVAAGERLYWRARAGERPQVPGGAVEYAAARLHAAKHRVGPRPCGGYRH